MYQAPNSLTSVLHMYQQMASDNVAQVVSTSWGQCEARDSGTFLNAENTIFQQMAAQGQTMLAASGDAGSSDCDNPISPSTSGLAVDDPASQPFVTGVGGTNLQTATGPESTWNEGTVNGGLSAGGGGVSAVWPMQSWQTALAVTSGNSRHICGQSAGSTVS